MDKTKHIVIIGGGISGLGTAFYLNKIAVKEGKDVAITVLEASEKLGGKIKTDYKHGCIIEGGPDSTVAYQPEMIEMCHELGIGDQLLPVNEYKNSTRILKDGVLRPLPEKSKMGIPTSFIGLYKSKLLSPFGTIRVLYDLFLPRGRWDKNTTLADFISYRFGKELLDNIAEPLFGGIYGLPANELDIHTTSPQLLSLEQKYRSIILGLLTSSDKNSKKGIPFVTLKGGMVSLIEAIRKNLYENAVIKTNARVKDIDYKKTAYKIYLEDGEIINADVVVLTTQPSVASSLLKGVDKKLSKQLSKLPSKSAATITFGFNTKDIEMNLDGTGFLVPRAENVSIGGSTWTTSKFDQRAPEEITLIRVFIRSVPEDVGESSIKDMVAVAESDIKSIMKISSDPIFSHPYIFYKESNLFYPGHLDRIEALVPEQNTLHITGEAYKGSGLPACIKEAKKTAETIFENIHEK